MASWVKGAVLQIRAVINLSYSRSRMHNIETFIISKDWICK